MHENIALLQKIQLLKDSLELLKKALPSEFENFTDEHFIVAAVERYFQLVVDSAVDCNTLLLEMEHKNPEDTYFGTFSALGEAAVITKELAGKVAHSVGLRNALVHRYDVVEKERAFKALHRFIPFYETYLRALR